MATRHTSVRSVGKSGPMGVLGGIFPILSPLHLLVIPLLRPSIGRIWDVSWNGEIILESLLDEQGNSRELAWN